MVLFQELARLLQEQEHKVNGLKSDRSEYCLLHKWTFWNHIVYYTNISW